MAGRMDDATDGRLLELGTNERCAPERAFGCTSTRPWIEWRRQVHLCNSISDGATPLINFIYPQNLYKDHAHTNEKSSRRRFKALVEKDIRSVLHAASVRV